MYTGQKNSRAWEQHSSCCQLPPCGKQHSSCNSTFPQTVWELQLKNSDSKVEWYRAVCPGVLLQERSLSGNSTREWPLPDSPHLFHSWKFEIATAPNRGGAETVHREDRNKTLHRVTVGMLSTVTHYPQEEHKKKQDTKFASPAASRWRCSERLQCMAAHRDSVGVQGHSPTHHQRPWHCGATLNISWAAQFLLRCTQKTSKSNFSFQTNCTPL